MKFVEKMIWSCLLTLVVVFSIGEIFILSQNHHHLLESAIQQNISSYELEIYNLQTHLLEKAYSEDYNKKRQEMIEQVTYFIIYQKIKLAMH